MLRYSNYITMLRKNPHYEKQISKQKPARENFQLPEARFLCYNTSCKNRIKILRLWHYGT